MKYFIAFPGEKPGTDGTFPCFTTFRIFREMEERGNVPSVPGFSPPVCGIMLPMRTLRMFWRGVYDVRPGEGVRTLFMAVHMMFVLFAYYILKPVSRALFLNKFEIDQLPYLYLLIALAGGLLAYAYTRVAVRASLTTAVGWTTALSVLCLGSIWWRSEEHTSELQSQANLVCRLLL